MLKKLLLVASLILLAVIVTSESPHLFFTQSLLPPGSAGGVSSKADLFARYNFEKQRCIDPATGAIPDGIYSAEREFVQPIPARPEHDATKSGAGIQADNWRSRGPFNIGGRTRALALDINDENIILAGGVSGGMWRSTDGGASWIKTNRASDLHSVTAIVQDTRPGKTDHWYYTTGELTGNSASGGGGAFFLGDGIFRSTNGGQSWQPIAETISGTPATFDPLFDGIWNIALDASNPDETELYIAVLGAIYRSIDGGISWSRVLGVENNNSYYTDVAITEQGVVYATFSSDTFIGGTRGVFRSTDGVEWTRLNPSGWPRAYNRFVIGFNPADQNEVYFLGNTPGYGFKGVGFGDRTEWSSLWKYTYLEGDGSGEGGAWLNLSENLPEIEGTFGDFVSQGGYDLTVAVKPDDPNTVFIGGTNIYRSTDGFTTRDNITWIGGYSTRGDTNNYPDHHPDQHVLLFLPSDPGVIINANDGGVFRTDDAMAPTVSWTPLNNGYRTTQFYTIAIDPATPHDSTLIGGMQDNGTNFVRGSNGNEEWRMILYGDGAHCAIADGKTSYICSKQVGKIFRILVDNEGGVQNFARIDPASGGGYLFINPLVLDPNDNRVLYIPGGPDIWRNTNIEAIPFNPINEPTDLNWEKLNNFVAGDVSITALAISTVPADRLYYGTQNGHVYRIDNARTGSGEATDIWSNAGFPNNAYVNCIAVDRTNADNVIVVFSNYRIRSVFATTDGGSSWSDVSGNLEENPDGSGNGPSCRWAEFLQVGETTMYFLGTSTGLFSTTHLQGAETHWLREGAETIGNVVVDMIKTRDADGLVVAATHGNGVFSTNITTASDIDDQHLAPALFDLYSNIPNPFHYETSFEYLLNRDEYVTITIVNALGNTVTTLVDTYMPRGQHRISWDGRGRSGEIINGGVYYFHMQVGDVSRVRQFIKLR